MVNDTFSFSYKGYNAAVVATPGGTGGTFPSNTNVLELQEWGSIVEKIYDVVEKDFDDVINDFASRKARKIQLYY